MLIQMDNANANVTIITIVYVNALGLLANLKETRKVKWVSQVEATSIMSVVKE
jgi:hypothetical protein